jgi:serine/threonine protein kinase/DNA-binding beta-propeller fold protein YncE
MAELAPGLEVAGCRIEAVIGRGGMGLVYLATQLSLERPVALKAIAPELAGDPSFRERFKRESRIAASIEHPNVIPVYEAGEGDGLLYLIMRYVEGTDLRALIAREQGLEPGRAARLVAQIAAGLSAAHRRGLVHRDVKPANVLVDAGGEREHAYLTDFGIARHVTATSGLTRTGSVVGTLDYLAPERIQGDGGDGAGADVYAAGCVLFEALTGSVPYPRDNEVAKMYAHLNAPVPTPRELVPDLLAELDEIAQRAMAKDPAQRFGSAGELAQALTDVAAASRPVVPPAPVLPSLEQAVSSRSVAPLRLERESTASATDGSSASTEAVAPDPPATTVQTARPRRRRAPQLAVVAALAAVSAGAFLVLRGGDDPLRPEQVGAAIQLEGKLDGVEVGAGYVWVADQREGQVWRVDPETGDPDHVDVGENPDSVAVGLGAVWVTNTDSNDVTRLALDDAAHADLRSARTTTIKVGERPEGVLIAQDAVWVANGGDGTVTRIAGGAPPVKLEVGEADSEPVQLAATATEIWVTLGATKTIQSLGAEGRRDGPIKVGGLPRGIAYDPERKRLWVSIPTQNVLVVVNPRTGKVVDRVQVPEDPREVRYGAGAIWVTTAGEPTVTAVDPVTHEELGKVGTHGTTYGLGVGDTTAWAARQRPGLLVPVALRR